MEDEDFVADSDEDEQEMMEAQALEEERTTRRRLEEAVAVNLQQVLVSQAPKEQEEEQDAAEQLQITQEEQEKYEVEEAEVIEEEEETRDEQQEKEEKEVEMDGVLAVGTLVEVKPRTWPGINKQGGQGRVTRVHREKTEDGEEEIFYDVRYIIQGGFDRHVEREFVQSSELMKQQSDREHVDREYYHDDYINKPHEKKQKELEKKLEQMKKYPEQAQDHVPHQRKRKRSQQAHSKQVHKAQQDTSHSEVQIKERSRKMSKVDEKMFVLTERKISSPEVSSRPPSEFGKSVHAAPSPLVNQSKVTQRRRNRILESSDEHSSDGSDADNNRMQSPDQPDMQTDAQSNASHTGGNTHARRGKSVDQHPRRQRKKHKTSRRRFVGGYEHNLVDADGMFIQPEGNPTELPEDVIREIRLKLRSTKDGLMAQLQEIYAQQLENMASFQKEQNMVNQQLQNLGKMPSADLHVLENKMWDLDTYVTKKLVNAGEDAMNTVIQEIHKKRGRPPALLESLELEIGGWLDQLKECQPWVRKVQEAVKNELLGRGEEIPQEEIAGPAYSSDSGVSSSYIDEIDATFFRTDEENEEDLAYDAGFSYDYEPTTNGTPMHEYRLSERRLKTNERGQNIPNGTKRYRRTKVSKSATLDDFFFKQGSNNGYTSNFRLVGKHKKNFASDHRFNWVKLARKQQQRIGNDATKRPTGLGTTHAVRKARSIKTADRDGKPSIQDQQIRLRNQRFRSQPKQLRTRDTVYAQPAPLLARNSTNVFANGISFDDFSPEKQLRPAESATPTIHPSNSKQQSIDWETIFEIVSDSSSPTDRGILTAISREGQALLLTFGYPLHGALTPSHLFLNDDWEFEDCDNFRAVVIRRVARLRQLLNDLRIQESRFMIFLSEEGLSTVDGDGYTNTAEWNVLVTLEDAYHKAIASLAAQLLVALEGLSPSALPDCLMVVLTEFGALIRQLPDCNSLLVGCEAYFFFFEVASRDSVTTPLLTAVSRTYWYCVNLLTVLQPTAERLVELHAAAKQDVQDLKLVLSVDKVILAVVLFLFDWYIYLPTSHRLEDKEDGGVPCSPQPALSLWMLVRSCSTSSAQPAQGLLSAKEKQVWASLQAVYQQRCFDVLARCFIRRESCGGYLQKYSAKTTSNSNTEDLNEAFESQLLALDATWDLLAVLTRIYAEADDGKHEEAVCEAKWALVKVLLQPGERDFLPFNLPPTDYRRHSDLYTHYVLRRFITLSRNWHSSKDIIELILRKVWVSDAPHYPGDIAELPQFLKQYLSRCRKVGNGRAKLAAFAGECDDDGDITASICKIVWIHLTKLEKRAHRRRFCGSVLSVIPDTPNNEQAPASSALANSLPPQKKSGTDWNWAKQHATAVANPVKQVGEAQQRSHTTCGVGKERMNTALLLTFAVVGVCLECGDEEQFPIERPDKAVRNMEREVDFYCKEIIRWTSGKPECEVLAAQSLYILGALLLEKNSTEFPTVFWGLNERLEASVRNLQANSVAPAIPKQSVGTTTDEEKRHERFQSAAMSSLYQMRDLTKKMLEMPSSGLRVGKAYGPAVEKSLEHIFGAGMVACLNGGIQKFITTNDLKIAIEIFQLVLPRSSDEPHKCLTLASAPKNIFDENDALFALLDVDGISGGKSSIPAPTWTVDKCKPKAIELIISKMRLVLQQLVLNYPTSDARRFDELYAIDLLGMILSTCEVQFLWNNVTTTSVKHRNLAPRVLSAALKYNPEKEWFRHIFLREKGADQELSKAWILGTLDVSTFDSSPIAFTLEQNQFEVENASALDVTGSNQSRIRDSDYWAMLTDGIIYQLLRDNLLAFAAMDPHVLKVLVEVATTSKFRAAVRANVAGLHGAATLYDLHLDVFRSFCRSAGTIWESGSNMNQFRARMMNSQSGIFVAFLEAYKINFRRACREIDLLNHDWYEFARLFLRKAGVNATNGRSYHEMDDTNQSFDKRLTGLTTMFRFMYQCMDVFMFHCGEMAIGDTNPFFNAMELMFRQVNDAEFPQAIKRLEDQRRSTKRTGVRNVNVELRKDFCQAAMGFVDSVQLFFARQKYPSLIYWFAQTSEIYQTFSNEGWRVSSLRTLLVNILDRDGPLGIHSYYPDDEASQDSNLDIDVRAVRREAFYLSCGFFNCRCTSSFEHSQAQPTLTSCGRLQQLRKFVLDDFMRETFTFLLQEDSTSLLETMVPLSQFLRAVLNHANLNVKFPSVTKVDGNCGENNAVNLAQHDFQLRELYPCLEWMVECIIKVVPCEDAVHSSLCCVLLTELCGVMCEAIAFNDHRPILELIDLVELVISYLQPVLVALSKQSTAAQGTLFTTSGELPPLEKLSMYRFNRSGFRDIEVKSRFVKVTGKMDPYGITVIRASTDLLSAIRRVANQCKKSSDEQLQGLAMVST
ncbi:hypothetical protein V7S43_004528 [Phytophthora oleae]|uniref:Uncharacterized protein n=1 Tax=Phytophthora oleae TaxID=2107226 RepID=A0ABD3FTG2_9STRA